MVTETQVGFQIDPATEPAAVNDTLTAVLQRRAAESPDQPHLHLRHDDGRVEEISYRRLLEGAQAVARGLVARGIHSRRGHGLPLRPTVAIMQPTSPDFFYSFFGALLAGAVPVPIYPPFRPDQIEEYAQRQSAILSNAHVQALVTFHQAERLARLLQPRIPSLRTVATVEKLASANGSLPPDDSTPEDMALIQYTSGSTGRPKGVVVTHGSLVNFLRSMRRTPGLEANDVLLAVTSLSFDIAALELFLPLTAGARVVIAPHRIVGDGHALARLLATSAFYVSECPRGWVQVVPQAPPLR